MENFDLVSAVVGAVVALMPSAVKFVVNLVKASKTKVDDQMLEALKKALNEKPTE